MFVMWVEGWLVDEMYLMQFVFEEVKYIQVFCMWLDVVGISEDLYCYFDDLFVYC